METNHLNLNKIGKVTVHTTASMTKLLEILYDIKLKVHHIHQQEMTDCPNLMKRFYIPHSSRPIQRVICLVDVSERPLLNAITLFYKDNMNQNMLHQLYHTDTPIGNILEKNKLEIYREVLDYGIVQNANASKYLRLKQDEKLIYRITSVRHQAKNLFLVCEYLPLRTPHGK